MSIKNTCFAIWKIFWPLLSPLIVNETLPFPWIPVWVWEPTYQISIIMNKEAESVEIIIEIANVHTNYCIILRQGRYTDLLGPLKENVILLSPISFCVREPILLISIIIPKKRDTGAPEIILLNRKRPLIQITLFCIKLYWHSMTPLLGCVTYLHSSCVSQGT